MAEGRVIYKTISSSRKMKELETLLAKKDPILAGYGLALFPLLISHTDDFGRYPADAFTVKFEVVPCFNLSEEQVEVILDSMEFIELIEIYSVGGKKYLQILNHRFPRRGYVKAGRYPGFDGIIPKGDSGRKGRKSQREFKEEEDYSSSLNLSRCSGYGEKDSVEGKGRGVKERVIIKGKYIDNNCDITTGKGEDRPSRISGQNNAPVSCLREEKDISEKNSFGDKGYLQNIQQKQNMQHSIKISKNLQNFVHEYEPNQEPNYEYEKKPNRKQETKEKTDENSPQGEVLRPWTSEPPPLWQVIKKPIISKKENKLSTKSRQDVGGGSFNNNNLVLAGGPNCNGEILLKKETHFLPSDEFPSVPSSSLPPSSKLSITQPPSSLSSPLPSLLPSPSLSSSLCGVLMSSGSDCSSQSIAKKKERDSQNTREAENEREAEVFHNNDPVLRGEESQENCRSFRFQKAGGALCSSSSSSSAGSSLNCSSEYLPQHPFSSAKSHTGLQCLGNILSTAIPISSWSSDKRFLDQLRNQEAIEDCSLKGVKGRAAHKMNREEETDLQHLAFQRLKEMGVNPATALELSVKYPPEKILTQIEKLPKRKARNPPSLLVESIRKDYK